ncbi:hypothetical protein [Microtetraspora niveoalba]|uniref:hypothetical protein n=1 Tax=Microtetraspora niveoalba TaxID=46175 RepID=UPI00082D1767|nr:hypothetical protein [Microtetraspora niveoalba]
MIDHEFSPSHLPSESPPRRRLRRGLLLGAAALMVAAGTGAAATGAQASSPAGAAHGSAHASVAYPSSAQAGTLGPLGAVGTVAAFAQPSPSPTGPAGPPGHGMEGPLGSVHGELVVPKRGGGYQTVITQTGKVTAIKQDSVSVKSTDGYAHTYAIDDSTRVCADRKGLKDITIGDTVWVISPGKENNSPAALIVNLSRPQWPSRQGGAGSPAAPTPSESPS